VKYWLHRTDKGKVVYERPKHSFTQRDVDRITRAVLEEKIGAASPIASDPETVDRWIQLIIFVLDDASERMLDVILSPLGLASYSDDVVDAIKKAIQDVIDGIAEYLKEARGPLGIPPGVF